MSRGEEIRERKRTVTYHVREKRLRNDNVCRINGFYMIITIIIVYTFAALAAVLDRLEYVSLCTRFSTRATSVRFYTCTCVRKPPADLLFFCCFGLLFRVVFRLSRTTTTQYT